MTTSRLHTPSRHARFWALAFLAFLGLVWLLGDVLTPFALGFGIAYFLDPLVCRITRYGVSRGLATFMVLLFFFAVMTALIAAFTPIVTEQIGRLVTELPNYIDSLRGRVQPYMNRVFGRFTDADYQKIKQAVGENASQVANMASMAMTGVMAGGRALLGLISFFVIMPVVAFYIMRDWPSIVKTIDNLFPRRAAPTIRAELKKVDDVLSGFVRGQTLVCFTLGLYNAIALTLVGLNFGFIIGLLAGLFSFVPYVGTFIGFMMATSVGIAQFGFETQLYIVWGVLVVSQLLEGYVLIPRLIGERVGLHDLWVIFAIMVGGALFGFLGVILAVPVAAVIGIALRFGLNNYKRSRYYLGGIGPRRHIRPI